MRDARRSSIWPHDDFDHDQLALADAENYAKSRAATRVAPAVPQLRDLLWEKWATQGRPDTGLVCRPRRACQRGRRSVEALYVRCDRRWPAHRLTPLGLHVARHACASYLRAAGVPLKVRSAILGPASTSSLSMTEDRYTHLMPGDLDAAKQALGAYLRAKETAAKTTRRTPFGHPWHQTPDESGFTPP